MLVLRTDRQNKKKEGQLKKYDYFKLLKDCSPKNTVLTDEDEEIFVSKRLSDA